MKNFIQTIFKKRYHLVVEEADVTKALEVINKHHRVVPDMRVGNCGWVDSTKWFIHFTTTAAKWELIRKELCVVRVYRNMDIPDTTAVGIAYSTD